MPKAEYIRKINQSSLLITPEKEYETEKDSIGMFQYHAIPDFLNLEVKKKNTNAQFCYDITSKRSLEQLLEYKSLDYLLLIKILSSFDHACTQTEDYMMTEDDILLEPEFVFVDHNIEKMSYCYLPGNRTDICRQFKGFMGYLLQHLDHRDERAVQLAYFVYQRVVEDRTALHHVLQDDRFHQFAADTDTGLLHITFTEESALVMDERYRQRAEGVETTQAADRVRNPQELERGRETQAAERAWEQQALENICKGQKTDNAWEQQALENTWKGKKSDNAWEQQKLDTLWQQQKQENACMQQKSENLWNLQETVMEEDSRIIKRQQPEKRKQEKSFRRKQAQQQGQPQNAAQFSESVVETKVRQKESIRKHAAEKLKSMLRKKIYTDRDRFTQEDMVFEADPEQEETLHSNPTVCLMPEDAGIQNRFVYQGPDRTRDFQCMSGKMLLGSDMSESDIYIPVPMVSRVHARIEIDAQGAFLEDMNSTNGTHVNGELLQFHERRILQKGDIISLAGECYSFH